MYDLKLRMLQVALLMAWEERTAKGFWYELEPSLNQCAVTALVVQDYLGGELLRSEMTNGDSHYWNRLPDGREIDFTRAQFEFLREFPLRETAIIRERDYVLSFPDTLARYHLLAERVSAAMKLLRR